MNSEYMNRMNEDIRIKAQEYSGYGDGPSETVPFHPIPLDGAFCDTDDVPMCSLSNFEEAQEKVIGLMEGELDGDNRKE